MVCMASHQGVGRSVIGKPRMVGEEELPSTEVSTFGAH